MASQPLPAELHNSRHQTARRAVNDFTALGWARCVCFCDRELATVSTRVYSRAISRGSGNSREFGNTNNRVLGRMMRGALPRCRGRTMFIIVFSPLIPFRDRVHQRKAREKCE